MDSVVAAPGLWSIGLVVVGHGLNCSPVFAATVAGLTLPGHGKWEIVVLI